MSIGWLAVYAGAICMNVYIGRHYWHDACQNRKRRFAVLFSAQLLLALLTVFYLVLYFTAASRNMLTTTLSYIAAGYTGILLYMSVLYLLSDLTRLILRKKLPAAVKQKMRRLYCGGLAVFLLAAAITAGGIWNAQKLVLTRYELELPRKTAHIDGLHAVLLSDTHLGMVRSVEEWKDMLNRINALKPEAVFLCGDIFDESTTPQEALSAASALGGLHTRYGIFYIPGNHEYSAGRAQQTMETLAQAGVIVLDDRAVLIENSFYVAGRIDAKGFRASLDTVLQQVSRSDLPLILLDHRPLYHESGRSGKVDLQLSGHTHNGQIFPYEPLRLLGRLSYGVFRPNSGMQVAVTSGAGMFGLPLRIGSNNEIVELFIRFV